MMNHVGTSRFLDWLGLLTANEKTVVTRRKHSEILMSDGTIVDVSRLLGRAYEAGARSQFFACRAVVDIGAQSSLETGRLFL